LIRESFPVTAYEPRDRGAWDEAYGRFREMAGEG